MKIIENRRKLKKKDISTCCFLVFNKRSFSDNSIFFCAFFKNDNLKKKYHTAAGLRLKKDIRL